MCSIDKSIDKVSRYFWYRDTKKYRGIRDTSIVKFWYRDISKYRQYRTSLVNCNYNYIFYRRFVVWCVFVVIMCVFCLLLFVV